MRIIFWAKKRLQARLEEKKSRDGYICMYEYDKTLLYSTYERVCAAQETTISIMKEIFYLYSSEIKKICSKNRDMQT